MSDDNMNAAIDGEVLPPTRTKAARPRGRTRSFTIKGEMPSAMTDPNPYSTMEGATRTLARQAASDVKASSKRATRDIIACGAKLVELKGKLKHGLWMKWIDYEFGKSDRTCQLYMRAAMVFADKVEIISDLAPTDVHLLARKSTPEGAIKLVLEEAEAGRTVKHGTVIAAIEAARPRRDELGRDAPGHDALSEAAKMIMHGLEADDLSKLVGLLKVARAVSLARAIDRVRHDPSEPEDTVDDGDEPEVLPEPSHEELLDAEAA